MNDGNQIHRNMTAFVLTPFIKHKTIKPMTTPIKILIIAFFFIGCKQKEKLVITIDMDKREFYKMDGDSVWTSDNRTVMDSVTSDGNYGYAHGVSEDTILKIINLKPMVVIVGDDTMVSYLRQGLHIL